MRALVTGITGFVGGHLAEHLLACGDALLGTSETGQWNIPPSADAAARTRLLAWELGDVAPPPAVVDVAAAFAPDCIYHLAAISLPAQCGADEPTPRAWAVNVAGTQAVIELALALPSRPRLLLASTAHVYAPPPAGQPLVTEDAPLGPRNGYGRTKLAAEARVREAAARGLDGVIARAFQHAGPRQGPGTFVPDWAAQFARENDDEPVRVVTLDAELDLSDVRDVVRAYRLLAERGARGEIYNVGAGQACTGRQVFDLLCQAAGGRRAHVASAPGVRRQAVANITRLTGATGWRPQIPLAATIADTLADWRRRNPRLE